MNSKPLPIVELKADHKFKLNIENLESILLRPEVKDRYVVVLAVCGAFRTGKSFLMNFFLRYLQAEASPDWLSNDKFSLEGFEWKAGSESHTSGMIMWSEPFIIKLPGSEKVAVLLMDTQGSFDSHSTIKECATIFALSTLISSVLVYNIMANIRENDLQYVQLFTEYGRLAMQSNDTKPFQRLLLLVRDWSYAFDHKYGEEGGEHLLQKRLNVGDSQHEQQRTMREHIHSCFDRIGCFLMPHPGKKVATNPEFKGQLADIEVEFMQHMKDLVPLLLTPQNLVMKEINGDKITGKDLVKYFKTYTKIYQGDELPEPKAIFDATAETNHLVALCKAKEIHIQKMEAVCGGDEQYMKEEALIDQHKLTKSQAIEHFRSARKMGGTEVSNRFEERLQAEIDALLPGVIKLNKAKEALFRERAVTKNLVAVAKAKEMYIKEMEAVCGADKEYVEPTALRDQHDRIEKDAIDNFRSLPGKGEADFSQEYEDKLKVELGDISEKYMTSNGSKEVIFRARAEADHKTAVAYAKEKYMDVMQKVYRSDEQDIHPSDVLAQHDSNKNKAIELFRSSHKLGGPELSKDYEEKLQAELNDLLQNYIKSYEEERARLQAESSHSAAVAKARDGYIKEMEAICGADKEYLKTTTLRDQHDDIKRRTIDNFRSNLKKGGPDFSQDYEGKLKAELDDLSRKYIEHNESKEDLLNLTADFRNFIAMTNARKKFQEDMDAERGGVQEYMKAAFFQFGLYTVKTIATEFVHSIINTGELDLDQDHEERLITELDDLVPLFIEHREAKEHLQKTLSPTSDCVIM